jgi:hypothetical protein
VLFRSGQLDVALRVHQYIGRLRAQRKEV